MVIIWLVFIVNQSHHQINLEFHLRQFSNKRGQDSLVFNFCKYYCLVLNLQHRNSVKIFSGNIGPKFFCL